MILIALHIYIECFTKYYFIILSIGSRDGNVGPAPPRTWPVRNCCGAGLGRHKVQKSGSY